MRYLVFAVATTFIVGCAELGKWVPSKYDNNEFDTLAEIQVIAGMPTKDWCNPRELQFMKRQSAKLVLYGKYRLNDNIEGIYNDLHSLVSELAEKEEPSDAYCKIKRGSIADASEAALKVFGGRK